MTAPTWSRWVRRLAAGVASLIAVVVLVSGGIYGVIQCDGNLHAVEPGVVYRSAQLSGQKLDEVVREDQIRTVLSLRGDNTGKPWYDDDCALRAPTDSCTWTTLCRRSASSLRRRCRRC